MKGSRLAATVVLVIACDAVPTTPESDRIVTANPPATHAVDRGLLIVNAPGQLVSVERDGGSERAWFEARLVVRGGTGQADGGILVVSAPDGVMPQTQRDATWISIQLDQATVDPDGKIHFAGRGTLSDATRELTFDVTGSATPAASCCPDDLIFDILGSQVYDATIQARSVIIKPA